MRKPKLEEIETAIEWLLYNDGENGEADACASVAHWLQAKVNDERISKGARKLAKETKMPLAKLRQELKRRLAS